MTGPDPTTQLKALTRQRMSLVWQLAQISDAQLGDEDRRIVAAMRQHSQYAHLWGRLDQLTDAEITADGTNPILHVTMHATIENQIAGGDPPDTGQAVAALEQRGFAHHEAVHRVASVLIDEIWHIMKEQRPFDPARYSAGLAELLRSQSAPPRPAARSVRRKPKQRR